MQQGGSPATGMKKSQQQLQDPQAFICWGGLSKSCQCPGFLTSKWGMLLHRPAGLPSTAIPSSFLLPQQLSPTLLQCSCDPLLVATEGSLVRTVWIHPCQQPPRVEHTQLDVGSSTPRAVWASPCTRSRLLTAQPLTLVLGTCSAGSPYK